MAGALMNTSLQANPTSAIMHFTNYSYSVHACTFTRAPEVEVLKPLQIVQAWGGPRKRVVPFDNSHSLLLAVFFFAFTSVPGQVDINLYASVSLLATPKPASPTVYF